MGNRKLPFGYIIKNGKIVPLRQEVEVIQTIFQQYLAGSSFKAITAALAEGSIPYEAEKAWNKNMVARILKDARYLGTEDYAAIITPEKYDNAITLQVQKAIPMQKSEIQKELRRLCNGKVTIRIEAQVNALLCKLIADPSLIRHSESQKWESNIEISRLQDELDRELDKPDFDESAAKAIIVSLATTKISAVGSEDYETIRIRQALMDADLEHEPTAAILHAIATAVVVNTNGAVSLKLKNGQIIERSHTT